MSRDYRVWRGALWPPRITWLRVLAAPSSYLLLLATLVTLAAKLYVVREIEGVAVWPVRGVLAAASDVALFLGLASLFAAGEARSPWLMLATIPLAVGMATLAVINAGYLMVSGEQLNYQVISVGIMRFDDVKSIVGAGNITTLLTALGIAVAVVYAATLVVLKRLGEPLSPLRDSDLRARATVLVAVIGLLLYLVTPSPSQYALQRLTGSAVLRTYIGLVTGAGQWSGGDYLYRGYAPRELVPEDAVERLRAGPRPNLVLVILESTPRHVTSLAGPRSLARTPNLVAMAERGFEATTVRAALPHTTKSVWSMLCGRLPWLQGPNHEASGIADVQCLPALLTAAGWKTAFYQTAVGDFEDRPRLVYYLGFQEFAAYEDIGGQRLGYLAADDEELIKPLAELVDRSAGTPFFATLLTSATHHEYELSDRAYEQALRDRKPHDSDRDRHARMVEAADRLVGAVHELLRSRGLDQTTIVAVIGDHGEGFGEKGIRQHDNNFFEEGLRVPWVMTGPGIPHRRHTANATIPDLMPTLLEALSIELTPEAFAATPARSILHQDHADRILPFGCYYDARCRGFVHDEHKVVYIPELEQSFSFDLVRDPNERDARPLTNELRATLAEVSTLVDRHRLRTSVVQPEMNAFPPWRCPEHEKCAHPRTQPRLPLVREILEEHRRHAPKRRMPPPGRHSVDADAR